jgi:hypothetical protein
MRYDLGQADVTTPAATTPVAPIQTGQRGSPPSTYSILALLEGQPGAVGDVVENTLLRMLLIAPGLWLVGLRGRQLVLSTAAASASITVGLTGYYAWRGRRTT